MAEYEIRFLRNDGGLECFFVMHAAGDDHIRMTVRELMNDSSPVVQINQGDRIVYKGARPQRAA